MPFIPDACKPNLLKTLNFKGVDILIKNGQTIEYLTRLLNASEEELMDYIYNNYQPPFDSFAFLRSEMRTFKCNLLDDQLDRLNKEFGLSDAPISVEEELYQLSLELGLGSNYTELEEKNVGFNGLPLDFEVQNLLAIQENNLPGPEIPSAPQIVNHSSLNLPPDLHALLEKSTNLPSIKRVDKTSLPQLNSYVDYNTSNLPEHLKDLLAQNPSLPVIKKVEKRSLPPSTPQAVGYKSLNLPPQLQGLAEVQRINFPKKVVIKPSLSQTTSQVDDYNNLPVGDEVKGLLANQKISVPQRKRKLVAETNPFPQSENSLSAYINNNFFTSQKREKITGDLLETSLQTP